LIIETIDRLVRYISYISIVHFNVILVTLNGHLKLGFYWNASWALTSFVYDENKLRLDKRSRI